MNSNTTRRAVLGSVAGLSGCLGAAREYVSGDTEQPELECDETDTADAWHTYQADYRNTGRSSRPIPATSPPTLAWSVDVGDREGGVVSHEDVLYVGASDALAYTGSGGRRWSRALNTPLEATPTIACDLVLFVTLDSLVAVGRNEGTVRWKKQLGIVSPSLTTAGEEYSVCVGRTVYHGSLDDGSVDWTFDGTDSSKRGLCRDDTRLYVVAGDDDQGVVHALEASSGTEVWRAELVGQPQCPPVLGDETILTVTSTGQVVAFDADDGERKWTAPAHDTRVPPPAVSDSRVYVASGNGDDIVARELSTGTERWRVTTGPTLAPPVVAENGILVGTMNRGLVALSKTGEQLWRIREPMVGSPLCLFASGLAFKDGRSSTLNVYGW